MPPRCPEGGAGRPAAAAGPPAGHAAPRGGPRGPARSENSVPGPPPPSACGPCARWNARICALDRRPAAPAAPGSAEAVAARARSTQTASSAAAAPVLAAARGEWKPSWRYRICSTCLYQTSECEDASDLNIPHAGALPLQRALGLVEVVRAHHEPAPHAVEEVEVHARRGHPHGHRRQPAR